MIGTVRRSTLETGGNPMNLGLTGTYASRAQGQT